MPIPPIRNSMTSPCQTPLPSPRVASLHLGSPSVQIVDLRDGSNSEEETTKSNEATKEALTREIEVSKSK